VASQSLAGYHALGSVCCGSERAGVSCHQAKRSSKRAREGTNVRLLARLARDNVFGVLAKIHSSRVFLDDLDQLPVLPLADWSALLDHHLVADVADLDRTIER